MQETFVCKQNGIYKITSAARQNLALDACRDNAKLNKLIIYDYHGGPNQKFMIAPCENNTFAFFCTFNNGTVEVPANSNQDGAHIEVNQPNNTPNEKWTIVPVKGQAGVYEIISFCGKALDIEG